MEPKDAAPKGPPRRMIRRPFVWAAIAIVGLLLSAGGTWALLPAESGPPGRTFRFDAVYVGQGNESDPNALRLELWFTNPDRASLKEVRIVAVAVETGRNMATDRAETSLDRLPGRTTQERTLDLGLNASRAHRIDLLVLVEGLLVARGEGNVGPHVHYFMAADGTSAVRTAARLESPFTFDYLNGAS